MRQDTVASQQYLSFRTTPTQRVYECQEFIAWIELKNHTINLDMEVQGHIVLECKETMPNKDFLVSLSGECIYFSENPLKNATSSEQSTFVSDDSILDIINHGTGKLNIPMKKQNFLQGNQLLRYAGDEDGLPYDITTLKPGRYYLPFNLHLPNNLPPTIGLLNFQQMHFSVLYKVILEQSLEQQIKLVDKRESAEIEQFQTNTMEFNVRKHCFQCLGRYRIQVTITIKQGIFRVKLLYLRIGQRGTQLHLDGIKLRLMAKIPTVGQRQVYQKQVFVREMQYGILGSEFLMDVPNTLKSYHNELFSLEYYIDLVPVPKRYISLNNISRTSQLIPL